MKKIKIAIIGTGGISECHIEGYKKHPEVEIYAFCDIHRERVEAKAARHGVPLERCFTDKDGMLRALPEIDAVSVCTWNSAHAPCAIAALKAGKHVLCEKPMAMNTREARAMQAAAEKAGKLLMIGFVRRHGNDARVIKEFVDKGAFGEIYYTKAAYLRRNGNPGGWFGDKSRSGGGPLIDLGVHVIDFVRYVIGNPQPGSVYGATFRKLGNRSNLKSAKSYLAADAQPGERTLCDVEDLATAMIRFDNGTVLHVEASFSLNIKTGRGDIEFFGTKAGAKLDPKLEIFGELNDYMVNIDFADDTALSFSGLFDKEIRHFVDCVLGRQTCIAPAEDGVVLTRILDAIYQSAATGHEVRL
jgi:predicted dehydrogenase